MIKAIERHNLKSPLERGIHGASPMRLHPWPSEQEFQLSSNVDRAAIAKAFHVVFSLLNIKYASERGQLIDKYP